MDIFRRMGAAALALCLLLQSVPPALAQVVSVPVNAPVAPVSVGGIAPVSLPKPSLTLSPSASLVVSAAPSALIPSPAVPAAAAARAAASASAVAAPKAVAAAGWSQAQSPAKTPLASLKEAAPAVAKAPAPALRELFDGGTRTTGRSGVVEGRAGGLSRTGLSRSAWWRDTSASHAGVTVPLYALRREESDPGVGKFTDFGRYYRDVLSKQGAKVVHLLPHFAVRGESPYAPVSLYAVNEDNLDWAAVPEVKADAALLARLKAANQPQRQAVDYAALRSREDFVAGEALRRFDRGSERGRQFEAFKKQNASWLGEYGEFMALSKAIGKPVLEWTAADQAAARAGQDFAATVERHEFAQWLAYAQLREALELVHQAGGRVLFDIPMFRGKDSVDAWKRPEVFTDLRTRNPGIKNQWINEDWKDLGLWNWTRARGEGYRAMLAPYRHWLDLGFDGARVDALHFAYNFGNGQLVSGDEPGDDYLKALSEVFKERGAFPLAEAFEGKAEAAERFGFVTVYGDWKKVSSHDDPRSAGFMGRFLIESRKAGSGRNARFTGYTLGDEWGDPFPVKEMADGTSHWRWRIPLPSDPDYANRAPSDVRAQLGAWMATLAGRVWDAAGPLKGAFFRAANSFVMHAGGGVQIWAASLDWFLEEWGRDTFISLPGLLNSTGRKNEARENIRGFARHEQGGLIPNRLPGGGAAAEYNTVDGSMWFVQAVRKLGDSGFAAEMLPVVRRVMKAYAEGTGYRRYGRFNRIYMDSDGLIVSPAQATWMDADPEGRDRPVTPRNGKAVEINALWYANLRYLAELERAAGEEVAASEADARADLAKRSFNKKFWFSNEDNRRAWGGTGGALRDVVEGDPHGTAVRPNMLFAVSHGLDLLSPERQRAVVQAATRDLLTPYGLRTLSYRDSRYQARYDTSKPPLEKDQAYHQGTAWPWLIGSYLDALARVRAEQGWSSERITAELRGVLTPLAEFLAASAEGSLPEVFDGGGSDPVLRDFSLEDPAGLGPAMARAMRAQNRGGTRSQAWSVAEVLRIMADYGLLAAPGAAAAPKAGRLFGPRAARAPPNGIVEEKPAPSAWDKWTHRLTDSAILAFLPLQIPQILKNITNLAAGNSAALAILPWTGYVTGILGNALLLSRFIANREGAAARVQSVGVLTGAVVLGQLVWAGLVPGYVPVLLGLATAAAVAMGLLQRLGKLSERTAAFWTRAAGWTATGLFMFGPAVQIVFNLQNPTAIAGLSLTSLALGALGNLLMLPRAAYTRDWIWFFGSAWAVAVGGIGVGITMVMAGALPAMALWGFAAFLPFYLGLIFYKARARVK